METAADERRCGSAGVCIGMVAQEDASAASGLRWELMSDAASLEENLGGMLLNTAGTRQGFTMLQLTSCMPGMSCSLHISCSGPQTCALPALSHNESVHSSEMSDGSRECAAKFCNWNVSFLMLVHASCEAGGVPIEVLEAGIAAADRALPSQLDTLEATVQKVCSASFSKLPFLLVHFPATCSTTFPMPPVVIARSAYFLLI